MSRQPAGKNALIEKLSVQQDLSDSELKLLIESEEPDAELFQAADQLRQKVYGKDVYVRGLIEFTNYCKNNCYYCGIRRQNGNVARYRLTEEQILQCCEAGYAKNYRTFVLQGGEDPFFTDDRVCRLVSRIKERYPDCAVTLSIGEKSRKSYQQYFDAGADRYLLRHETAEESLYQRWHPSEMSLSIRKQCLYDLKEIGYQVGAGFMVGAPFQRTEHLIADLRFLQTLDPDMIGIGPFIHQKDTPFGGFESGTLELTLRFLSILRLMFPEVLLPSTTALGTIDPQGREKGFRAGANVIMQNISPSDVRGEYLLYDKKLGTEKEAQSAEPLEEMISRSGYYMICGRGDRARCFQS